MVRYVRSDRVHGHDRGRTDNTTPVVTNVTTVELERRQGHSDRVHRAFEREPDRNVRYSWHVQQRERVEVHPEYFALELEYGGHFGDLKSIGIVERQELSS